ncbi:MAG: SBBP repeat-containing protein [Candidatus Brocadiia bacterium]
MRKTNLRYSLLVLLVIISLGLGLKFPGCVIWEDVKVEDKSGGSGDLLAPSNLGATPLASTRIDLTWTDNSFNESGFRVERSDDAGISYSQIGLAAENETVFSDETITVADIYYYRLCSYNLSGNSLYAGPISTSNTAPILPSLLTGTAKSYTQIDLVWQDNSNNETGFKVYRATDGVNFQLLKAILSDDPLYRTSPTAITATYTDAGLAPTTSYYYKVLSYNTGLGDSAYSNIIQVTTLSVTDLVKTWGGSSNEAFNKMTLGSDASIYLCGYSSSYGAGSRDALLMKYDSGGKITLQKTWGQTADDEATGIVLDNDKNIYISGRTYNFSSREGAVFLTKYNPFGTLQWSRLWDGNNSENANSMVRTTGGIYIVGETRSYGAGETDMLILKYTEEGSLTWTRTWGTPTAETANAIAADGSGNIYITGETNSVSTADVAIISMDPNANIRWRRMWIDNNNERGRAIAVSATGDVYIAGETDSSGAGSMDVVLYRYNSAGGIQWVRRWGGYRDDNPYGIAVDSSSGNIYICGTTDSFYTSKSLFLVAYNSLGDIQSQQVWEGTLDDSGFFIKSDQFSVFTCGSTRNKTTEGAWTNISGSAGSNFSYARTLSDNQVGGTTSAPGAVLAGPVTGAIDGTPAGVETGAGQDDTLLLRTRK